MIYSMLLMTFLSFIFASQVFSDDALYRQGLEANDLAQAQDYDKSAAIYERMLKQPLPDWQKAIVLYNLGTVKLAQKQYQDALNTYQLIPLESASTPQLIRSFYLNKGIAFLNQANELSPSKAIYDLYTQLDLYQEALQEFEEVHQLDCQLRTLEGEDLATPCPGSPDLQALQTQALNAKKQVEKLIEDDEKKPPAKSEMEAKQILTKAWLQARMALKENGSDTAKDAQQEVLNTAKRFIPAVLAYEKQQYISQHCQRKPWDQVIPLFDKGYLAAISSKKLPEVSEQKKTVQFWREALKLMDQKPSQEATPQSSQNTKPAQNINETLRLIQEMQSEDQPGQQPSSLEIDTW